ncbi:cupin domain-containing protein [Saxibacter everestensis]|uniref:Cupin domain-containing protein n=1 Tax=Saxibacter everestensis TaxID=2909229 RepID=A0ABY8QQM5_9MICO|nr:cupin domain-containing protein [Brevibacteriaceae bacterium ZFBP1038]
MSAAGGSDNAAVRAAGSGSAVLGTGGSGNAVLGNAFELRMQYGDVPPGQLPDATKDSGDGASDAGAAAVVGGRMRPQTAAQDLAEFEGLEVGVWEMTVGTMSDVEADEIFVVLSGRAVVEIVDGEGAGSANGSTGKGDAVSEGDTTRLAAGAGPAYAEGKQTLSLKPGDIVRLAAGTQTWWTVTEPLRKVYLTPVG